MGPYSSSRGIFGNQGLGVHLNNDEEFSVRGTNWSKIFSVLGKSVSSTNAVAEDSRVFVGGKLGIGTTDPVGKLEIRGTNATSDNGSGILDIKSISDNKPNLLRIASGSSTSGNKSQAGLVLESYSNGGGHGKMAYICLLYTSDAADE